MVCPEDTFALLHNVMKKMRRIAEKELLLLEIGSTEMRILMQMYFFYADGCSQEELASQADVDRSNVGRALKKLEQLRYINRIKNEKDRRGYNVFLTEKGRAVREQLLSIRTIMSKTFTLEMTAQEIDLLTALLKKADCSLNEENYRRFKTQREPE